MLSNRSLKFIIGLSAVAGVILLAGIIFLVMDKLSYTVYDQDTLIQGDLIVSAGNPIKLKNNAKLTITGDAVIEDQVRCIDGGVNLEIQGDLIAKNEMNCDSDPEEVGAENAGINLVIKGNAIFTSSSKVVSTGSVQFVDDESKLVRSQEQIDVRHENLDQLEGTGIGPLDEEGEDFTMNLPSKSRLGSFSDMLVPVAHAQIQGQLSPPNIGVDIDFEALEQAELELLIDLMRQYIASEKPDDTKIQEFVKEIIERMGLQLDDTDFFDKLTKADIYLTLVEAPNPEELTRWFFERALIQGETVVIVQGEIIIGDGRKAPFDIDISDDFKREGNEQEKPKRVLLNYDFSDDKGLALQNITITGLDGVHYGGVTAPDCTYKGQDGGDAMRFTGRAGRMRIGNVTLNNGDGGTGETVVSPRGCTESKMTGGEGGKPGNIRLVATQEFVIDGSVYIVPGEGGQGGGARASIKLDSIDRCPAEDGKPVEAIGGDGGDSKQRLRTSGSVAGLGNVQIDPSFGGNGGPAIADGIDSVASSGETCGCAGGNGSPATAKGGNGGDASRTDGSKGGNGGTATAFAGFPGDGGSCGENEGPGGKGGDGGNAIATPGAGGNGNQQGADGQVINEVGGDAGFGGNGCSEGKAGAVGTGQTPGLEAEDGDNTCKADAKPKSFISVILFNGLSIPVFQLRVAGPDACDGDHWHGGPAKSTTGEIVNDPAPEACGFGKRNEVIPMDEAVDQEKMIELFGPSITEHLVISGNQEMTKEAPANDCSMVRICMVGGSWITCPGQEDIVARNAELGC